ncbi:MAG: hypothetical protein H6517_04120 [Microthrixaceae bacterium]|nr:hypothetical protein [Microthrixaceae bacterium]MCO5321524.1 hypothetical protein [Microthrixaceae bacterium]
MSRPQLSVVRPPEPPVDTRATALRFSETVRTVVGLSRRGRLVTPVFRSPPALEGMDRTIRWRCEKPPVVAIAREGRPLAAVQSDVIEAVVVANSLDRRRADRFRRAAWNALEGTNTAGPGRPRRRSALQTADGSAEAKPDPQEAVAADLAAS